MQILGVIKPDSNLDIIDSLDPFTRAYIEAALWSTMDSSRPDGGDPLDKNYNIYDIAPEALKEIIEVCADFQSANADDLAKAGDPAQNGHDFLLTRDRHGAGFWDRGYDDDIGERLTAACKPYGDSGFYVGDDGKIYVQ